MPAARVAHSCSTEIAVWLQTSLLEWRLKSDRGRPRLRSHPPMLLFSGPPYTASSKMLSLQNLEHQMLRQHSNPRHAWTLPSFLLKAKGNRNRDSVPRSPESQPFAEYPAPAFTPFLQIPFSQKAITQLSLHVHTISHTYVNSYTYACIYAHIQIHSWIYTYAHACFHIYTYIFMLLHLHTFTYILIYACTYIFIYMYMNMYMFMYMNIHS